MIAGLIFATSAIQLATPSLLGRNVLVPRLLAVALALIGAGLGPLALVRLLTLA